MTSTLADYEEDFAQLSLAIIGDDPFMVRTLANTARPLGLAQTASFLSLAEGRAALAECAFHAVVYYSNTGDCVPLSDIRAIRREHAAINRFSGFIYMPAQATLSVINAALNAGADEFMTPPLSTKTLARRLIAITRKRRPFVITKQFCGPDRRRRPAPVRNRLCLRRDWEVFDREILAGSPYATLTTGG